MNNWVVGTLLVVPARWMHPVVPELRPSDVRKRAEILVDLLDLSDALPAVANRDQPAPTFRELCGRR